MLSLIAAVALNRVIGCQGRLPWQLPADMAHFKSLTMGHTIIMGRKTFESLPHGALPGRRNMVLSHQALRLEGAEVYPSLDAALAHCPKDEEVFVIGGETVYQTALPLADRLVLTLVEQSPEGDAFFPPIDRLQWRETKKEKHHGFSFVELVRI
ncbi:MAG: dihydrofolate reductase [Prevotella sp.]|jgi:dihydrofolate reductase|nr:dihydrofolate reductase [Prevotella sp.]